MLRIQGLAASVPYDRADPLNPINRRISIIVMNRDAEDRFLQTAQTAATAEAPAVVEVAAAPLPAVAAASSAADTAR